MPFLLLSHIHREHACESAQVRSALGFLATCSELPVTIYEDELIVGNPGAARRAGSVDPELSWRWIEAELDGFESRGQDPYRVTEAQKRRLREEIFPFWRGRSLEEAYLARLKAAFFRQLAYLVKQAGIATLVAQQVHSEQAPRPFLSLMVEGCMEAGRDLSRGGAGINVGAVLTGIGLADAANALEAARVLVFERRSATMATLCQALARDWEGFEPLRAEALACPKYGNDLDRVDRLALEISDVYQREVRSRKDWFGQPFNSAFMGISNYIPAGAVVGATPDGRKAGAPLTEGCAAHAGTDHTSPTALMRSAARISHESHSGGTLLNLKLSPDALRTDRDLANLAALIRGYFELGAFHVQFNVISPETLRAAQQHPGQHQDLLVRVAGYSARFVTLSREVQDAIIARTSYAHL